MDFNPRSPRGERPEGTKVSLFGRGFQSTLPARGATRAFAELFPYMSDFNPRSPRGERLCKIYLYHQIFTISIHAPREGSDRRPRAACRLPCHFNPRSPRGERQGHIGRCAAPAVISIHAPREGSDATRLALARSMSPFQSTLPARGATIYPHTTYFFSRFQSTLPARGATRASGCTLPAIAHFNPRSPRGERPNQDGFNYLDKLFQSTLPARGATHRLAIRSDARRISIHAPREGSDRNRQALRCDPSNFNPRSPRGERRFSRPSKGAIVNISIHAPREGSDP